MSFEFGHAQKYLTKKEFRCTRKIQVNLHMKKEEAAKLKNEVLVQRERRYFSEAARKSIVEEIDKGLSKSEASRKYGVSHTSLYKWLSKYSTHYQSLLVKVVEHASEGNRVKQLEAELEQTYAMLGRMKAENLFLQTVLDKADESLGTSLKKNFEELLCAHSTTKKTKSR